LQKRTQLDITAIGGFLVTIGDQLDLPDNGLLITAGYSSSKGDIFRSSWSQKRWTRLAKGFLQVGNPHILRRPHEHGPGQLDIQRHQVACSYAGG